MPRLSWLCLLLALGCVSASPRPAEPLASKDTARLQAIATRLEALSRDLFAFWKVHGHDARYGGFFGTLDRRGHPTTPTDKGLIQEARHLWSFSMWYRRREATPEVRALADDLYRFIVDHFRDQDGEFFSKVSEAGAPVERTKPLYTQAFAVYALCEYSRAFGVKEAAQLALECFRSVDGRAHDAEHGGYDQRHDAWDLSPGAEKDTNTHLHLMEGWTALLETTGDPVVRARTEELAEVVAERIIQPDGYAAKEFRLDFTPVGTPTVSYGHDLETGWLLLETARALGRPEDPRLVLPAKLLSANSAAAGFDPVQGGYFEEGPPGGAPTKTDKVWWIQAEALPSLYRLYRLTGNAAYLNRLERTLDYVEKHQRDARYGGWYAYLRPDGSLGKDGDLKGHFWKASYHELRALVFTEDWIRR